MPKGIFMRCCVLGLGIVFCSCAASCLAATDNSAYANLPPNAGPSTEQPTERKIEYAPLGDPWRTGNSIPLAPSQLIAPPQASPLPRANTVPQADGAITPASFAPPGFSPSQPPVRAFNHSSHWYAGADVGATQVDYTSSIAIADDNVAASVRPYIGWESWSGVGIRLNAWLYGVDTEALEGGTSNRFGLEVRAVTVDIDWYKNFQIDETSLKVGVGSSGAQVDFEFPDLTVDSIEAGGISLFAEGYHPISVSHASEWGFFGGGRTRVLSGELNFDNSTLYTRASSTLTVNEAHLGIQYLRQMEDLDLVARFFIEHQIWRSNAINDISFETIGGRLGLAW